MKKEFWQEAWDNRNIGFHQGEYNPLMVSHFKDRDIKDKTILIPLAGKTKDVLYFLEKGAKVIAVEVVSSAVEEFFKESELEYDKREAQDITTYTSKNLTFYNADFFKAQSYINKDIDYVYDRASNVALPLELRKNYYSTIKELVNRDTQFLIITFSHDGPKDFGPPFFVPFNEIEESYKEMGFNLKKKETTQNNSIEGRFKEAGMSYMNRIIWWN